MGMLARGVSPRRIVLCFSTTISLVVLLWIFYLFSHEMVAVYVKRRHIMVPQNMAASNSVKVEESHFDSSPQISPPEYHNTKVDDYDLEYAHSVMESSPLIAEDDEDDKEEENEEITPVGVTNKDYDKASSKHSSITFSVQKEFNFPHPQVFLSTQKILNADWVHQLKDYLTSINPAHSLTITVATKSFIPNLLNWLIAAHRLTEPPIENVLVLAFDKAVFSLLSVRKIPCVYIPYNSVLKKLKKGVSMVWMTRLAVIRLLNHWGFDVLQLDTDAVPLKNPHLVFDGYSDYDVVTARGVLPFELGRGPWGFTLCMGAALLRGTQKMGRPLYIPLLFIKFTRTFSCFQRLCGT